MTVRNKRAQGGGQQEPKGDKRAAKGAPAGNTTGKKASTGGAKSRASGGSSGKGR
jgi:hypothetical protein